MNQKHAFYNKISMRTRYESNLHSHICGFENRDNERSGLDDQIAETIRKLILLRNKPRLKPNDVEPAKQLLGFLKKEGYSPEQTGEMTKGKWKVSTIKYYTKGVRAGEDSKSSVRNLGTVGDMAARGISLDQVENANTVTKKLDVQGVSIEQVSSLIAECNAFGLPIKTLASNFDQIRKSKIPFTDIVPTYNHRFSLEKLGINIKMEGQIVEAASKFGTFDRTMESINAYGKNQAIQSEIRTSKDALETIKKKVALATSKLKNVEKKTNELDDPLARLQRLKNMGFSEPNLAKLGDICSRYGGVSQVLDAVLKHGSLAKINEQIEKMEIELKGMQTRLDKVQAEHIYLSQVIAMCEKLLELKFTLAAIEQIFDIAQKYGEPVEVLRAIGEYGKVTELKKDSEAHSADIIKLLAQKKELEQALATLTGRLSTIQDQVLKTADVILTKLSEATTQGSLTVSKAVTEQADRLRKEIDSFAETMKNAGALEDDLRMATVVQAVTKYPIDSPEIQLRYASLFLELAGKVLRVKGVDPPVLQGNNLTVQQVIAFSLMALGPSKTGGIP